MRTTDICFFEDKKTFSWQHVDVPSATAHEIGHQFQTILV